MTIRISKDPAAIALQERWERLRGHKRIISRVKLLVEWEQGGAKEHANAVTVDVSHSGCMAVVGADLPLHKRVRLIQQETGRKADAEVVWRSHEAWDAGFELVSPMPPFGDCSNPQRSVRIGNHRGHFSLSNSSELFRGFGNRACGIRTFCPPGSSAKCRPS